MNKENLKRMAEHLASVPDENFGMLVYRSIDEEETDRSNLRNTECNSVGCVIGHCTVLDAANVSKNFIGFDEGIMFGDWSEEFTGLSILSHFWSWCFDSDWAYIDDTKSGAIRRIELLINASSNQRSLICEFSERIFKEFSAYESEYEILEAKRDYETLLNQL